MDFWQNDLLREWVERGRAGERVGLVTDVDGTISPIAPTPDAAQVPPRSRDLLRRLAGRLALVAAVSGRAADDLSARVGVPGLVYVGNHGLERLRDGESEALPEAIAARPALERVIAALRSRLLPGMILEDKGVTLSIHYRQSADPAAVEAAFAPLVEQISRENGLRYFRGKMIFEVRPAVEVNKGTAFARLIAEYALAAAMYIGDDVTDADALIMARSLRRAGTCFALGVGVESDDTPAVLQDNADVLVSGVSGVEALLDWLLSTLSAS
ncbi:MAG: trehalose-phosphatase [Anaerolineae bacterium]